MYMLTLLLAYSDIVDCFDDLLLLAEGRCVYHGPWSAALGYFEGIGHTCPFYKNPADFFMSLTRVGRLPGMAINLLLPKRSDLLTMLT